MARNSLSATEKNKPNLIDPTLMTPDEPVNKQLKKQPTKSAKPTKSLRTVSAPITQPNTDDEEVEDEAFDDFADDVDLSTLDTDFGSDFDANFDDPKFDENGDLIEEFDDMYEDEFGERPTRPLKAKKANATHAIVPRMPTSLSAPGVNLGAYVNAVHQIPILTPEQEQELAHRYTDEGDVEAARLLVMSHLRFVIHIARSYSGYGLPQGDLIQEGNVGLMKAVQRFDPNKGVRLVSFAVHWIKAEIHEFVIRNWRIVKVATTKAHRKLFFNLRSLKKTNNQLTLDEAEAIAKDLNVTVKQVLEMESRLTSYDASFEAQSDDDDEGRYAPQYYLEDDTNPADVIEDADWEESNNTALAEAMEELDDRSRDIVQQRWLNEQKATLHELAAEYNISAERVRQIEKNAMDKIKEAMLANTHLQLD